MRPGGGSPRPRAAFDLLEIDQGNPDDLLLLQLACRARELGLASES
jgi:hypothetical protein